MKKFLMVLALVPFMVSIVACGGAGPTGPGPIPTVNPTDAPKTEILGFKVWAGTCPVLPDPACEVLVAQIGPATFEVTSHNYADGYFEGYAHFTGPCSITGKIWSDPAESLLENSEEMGGILMAPIQGPGDHMFVKGIFRGRGPKDRRYADPAVLHITATCGGNPLNADIVVHLVK